MLSVFLLETQYHQHFLRLEQFPRQLYTIEGGEKGNAPTPGGGRRVPTNCGICSGSSRNSSSRSNLNQCIIVSVVSVGDGNGLVACNQWQLASRQRKRRLVTNALAFFRQLYPCFDASTCNRRVMKKFIGYLSVYKRVSRFNLRKPYYLGKTVPRMFTTLNLNYSLFLLT